MKSFYLSGSVCLLVVLACLSPAPASVYDWSQVTPGTYNWGDTPNWTSTPGNFPNGIDAVANLNKAIECIGNDGAFYEDISLIGAITLGSLTVHNGGPTRETPPAPTTSATTGTTWSS